MNTTETLLYLHIPKTAGTSVSVSLAARFPPHELYHIRANKHSGTPRFSPHYGPEDEFRAMDVKRQSQFRCVIGHFHFGLHEAIRGDSQYFTLLRDPLQRYISQVAQYNRMAAAGELGVETRPVSLYGFRFVKRLQFENPQTRWIAGLTSAQINKTKPDDVLELAKQNIVRHFCVIGLVERIEESMQVLARLSGWSHLTVCKKNSSLQRPSADQLTAAQQEEFDECNRLDRELWRFANDQLDQIQSCRERRTSKYVPGSVIRSCTRLIDRLRAS